MEAEFTLFDCNLLSLVKWTTRKDSRGSWGKTTKINDPNNQSGIVIELSIFPKEYEKVVKIIQEKIISVTRDATGETYKDEEIKEVE